MIEFETYHSARDLQGLGDVWEALLSAPPGGSVFLTPEWLVPWWEAFGRSTGELLVVVIKENGQVAGICPLVVRYESVFGCRIRKLVGPTNCHTPKFEFILRGDADRLVVALLHFLTERVGWNMLQLNYVPRESRILEALQQIASRGELIVRRETCMRSPFIDVEGGYDAYYRSLSKKFRQNADYALRGLSRLGPVEFEEIRGGGDLAVALREGFEIEKASWKGDQGTAILNKQEEWELYLRVAERTATKGWLRLYFVKGGGRRIAFCYCLSYRGIVSLVKVAYDPTFAKYSPGTLLQKWILERLFAESETRRYDMLGTDSEWKRRWTKSVGELQDVSVFRSDVAGRLLYEVRCGVKDRAKRVSWLRTAVAVIRGTRATSTEFGVGLRQVLGGELVFGGDGKARKRRGPADEALGCRGRR